ncbi:MAG: hypothetical protein PHN19_00725 [Patescibacteria group bacterium]|nr:hypothetical protein [Patescibacteria group bacterium]
MERQSLKENNLLYSVCQQIFGIFLIGYLFFFLLDQIFDNFVSNFINLNYILVVVIISGILLILFQGKNNDENISDKESKNYSWKYSIVSFFLGLVAAIIIFIKIFDLGILLSLFISLISGVLIALLSFLLLDFDESKNELE